MWIECFSNYFSAISQVAFDSHFIVHYAIKFKLKPMNECCICHIPLRNSIDLFWKNMMSSSGSLLIFQLILLFILSKQVKFPLVNLYVNIVMLKWMHWIWIVFIFCERKIVYRNSLISWIPLNKRRTRVFIRKQSR